MGAVRRSVLAWCVVLILGCAVAATSAQAVPALNCSSAGITATMDTFATVGVGPQAWVENLGFDGHGGMWASELEFNKLVRFDANGTAGASLAITSPGATGIEPDGRMFAVFGDSDFNSLPGGTPGGVETFDPQAAMPVGTPFASHISMPNGAVLDAQGNLYVANTMAPGILKYSPGGVLDSGFAAATQLSGADGVAISGQTLYVTELTSAAASIVQVPLGDPSAHSVLASLSPYVGPDDLAVGPDGALYVALASGQLVRIDTHTGASCLVIDTGVPATSVRFPTDFSPYSADGGDAFVSSESGLILHVHMTGLKPLAAPGPAATAPVTQRASVSVTVTPRRIRAAERQRLTVRVRAVPAACGSGATVRLGAATARTNRSGRVTFTLRVPHAAVRRTVTVVKAGCLTGRATVAVVAVPRPKR